MSFRNQLQEINDTSDRNEANSVQDDFVAQDIAAEDSDGLGAQNLPDTSSLSFYPDPEMNMFIREFMRDYTKGKMNRANGRRMWRLHQKYTKFPGGEPLPSFETLERKVHDAIPKAKVAWTVQRLDNEVVLKGRGECFPEKKFKDKSIYETSCIWTRIGLRDLVQHHATLHPNAKFIVDGQIRYDQVTLKFTYDGIPLGKSSPDTLNVMGVMFEGCKLVYIPHVRVARRSYAKNLSEFLDYFIDECIALRVKVNLFVGDAPMRAFIKCLKGHAGRFSCEVCEAKGVAVDRRICYPASEMGQAQRSHDRWKFIVDDLKQQREHGAVDNVKGIMGESPLLRLPGFDMVRKAPPDPFHRDWLGIAKGTLWKFALGLAKGGYMNQQGKRIADAVSDVYRQISLPKEFSHRSRAIDYANFKAHEWKSLTLSTFPYVCELLSREYGDQFAQIWQLFIFLVMIYHGPEWAMNAAGEDFLRSQHKALYEKFEEEFGQGACTFNFHSFSHMPEICTFARPTQLSTEPFESAYGQVQGSYAPGTRNIGLQITRNMLMRTLAHVEGRQCTQRLHLEEKRKSKRTDDSYIHDSRFNYYKILSVHGRSFQCKKVKTEKWTCVVDPSIPMNLIGVYKYKGLSNETLHVKRQVVNGKAIVTSDKLIIPFTKEMLFS